jgi:hypothetical protein
MGYLVVRRASSFARFGIAMSGNRILKPITSHLAKLPNVRGGILVSAGKNYGCSSNVVVVTKMSPTLSPSKSLRIN